MPTISKAREGIHMKKLESIYHKWGLGMMYPVQHCHSCEEMRGLGNAFNISRWTATERVTDWPEAEAPPEYEIFQLLLHDTARRLHFVLVRPQVLFVKPSLCSPCKITSFVSSCLTLLSDTSEISRPPCDELLNTENCAALSAPRKWRPQLNPRYYGQCNDPPWPIQPHISVGNCSILSRIGFREKPKLYNYIAAIGEWKLGVGG